MSAQNKHPQVTVLMSVFNGERWLHDSIASILGQQFKDFEFIIVNDGSQDESKDIIHRYASVDPRIRIIDKVNTGLADSLNVGIESANGEWIARIDADDVSLPSRLAIQLEYATRDKTCVLLGSAFVKIDEHGNDVGIAYFPMHHKQLCSMMLNRRVTPIVHSSAFIRTAAIRAVGGYRTRFRRSQDYDLWLRLSEIGTIANINRPLVRIREHLNQISNEDGGLRQMLDSRVALASFLLTRKGFTDPVATQVTQDDFNEFRLFILDGIIKDKLPEYMQYLSDIKCKLNSNNYSQKIQAFLIALSLPQFLFRYAKTRVFGEQLTDRLVLSWINRRDRVCAE